MLELQKKGQVPDDYRSILTLLLTPASWQQKGSIPGLVRLLKTFLARDSAQMFAAGQVGSVLAVVQQRLIPSKLNDAWGFELLQSVFLNVNTWVFTAVWPVEYIVLISRFGFQGRTCNSSWSQFSWCFLHACKQTKLTSLFIFSRISFYTRWPSTK